MPNWLPPRLKPTHRETLPSYVSRLAATKGVTSKNLALDMGVSLKRLIAQDPEALEQLKLWGRLSENELSDLLSWTGVGTDNIQHIFRGEPVGSRSLRNPLVHGCPLCLAEDADAHDGSPLEAMVIRGDWQFREVVHCIRHNRALVPLWQKDAPSHRYDIGERLKEILPDLLSRSFDQAESEATAYDHWLDTRLEDGSDTTWLARHPIYAGSIVCHLLGDQLRSLPGNASQDPHDLGFNAVRTSEEGFRDALDRLIAHSAGAQTAPGKAFGALYLKLSRDYINDASFDPFRALLRECIHDTWAIGAGEKILGETIPERRLHSVTTACSETGVGPAIVEPLLIEAGAISSDDQRPRARKTFDAIQYADLLAMIPQLVGPTAMRQTMGATVFEFQALVDIGALRPTTQVEGIKNPWLASEGLRFVEALRQKGQAIFEGDRTWESIQLASAHEGLSVGDILSAINAGTLSVGLRGREVGYHGVCVSREEVRSLKKAKLQAEDKGLETSMSVAEFGRSIGIRDHSDFARFVEAGHCPAHLVRPLDTAHSQLRMTQAQMTTFHRKFVTTSTIAAEFGLHRNTLLALLRAHDIAPFRAEGQEFGRIYLRDEVVAILPKKPASHRG